MNLPSSYSVSSNHVSLIKKQKNGKIFYKMTQNIRKDIKRAKLSALRCSQHCWSICILRWTRLERIKVENLTEFCLFSLLVPASLVPLLQLSVFPCSLCNSPLTLQFILTYIFMEMYNTSLHYGSYVYPRWGKAIGVCIGATCCLQIIIWAIVAISKETGTLKEVSLGTWGWRIVIIQSDLLQFLIKNFWMCFSLSSVFWKRCDLSTPGELTTPTSVREHRKAWDLKW